VQRDEERSELDEALANFGLIAVQADEVLEPLYLWPENVPSWNLFQSVMTQWVVSMDGAVGLHYPSVESVMRMWRIKPRDQRRKLREIQVMERATLKAWREQRENG
jgi:hypothetical protein